MEGQRFNHAARRAGFLVPADVLGVISTYLDARSVLSLRGSSQLLNQTLLQFEHFRGRFVVRVEFGQESIVHRRANERFIPAFATRMGVIDHGVWKTAGMRRHAVDVAEQLLEAAAASLASLRIHDFRFLPAAEGRYFAGLQCLTLEAGQFVFDSKNGDQLPLALAAEHFPRLTSLALRHFYLGEIGLQRLIAGHAERFPLLASLSLTGNVLQASQVSIIAEAADFASKLTSLDLNENCLEDEGALVISQSANLTNLTFLAASGCDIGSKGIYAITASHHFPKLRHLDLFKHQANLLGESLSTLQNNCSFCCLTHLTLGTSAVWGNAFRILAEAGHLANLQHLNLFGAGCEISGLEALSRIPTFPHLTYLDIGRGIVWRTGVQLLANSVQFPNLTFLGLGGSGIRDEGACLFAASPNYPRLRHFVLDSNYIGAGGVHALATSCNLPNLSHLDLAQNLCSLISALPESPLSENLTRLVLRDCRIGDAGGQMFFDRGHFAKLVHLDLGSNALGNRTAAAIAWASGRFVALAFLDLSDNGITDEGARALCTPSVSLANGPFTRVCRLFTTSDAVKQETETAGQSSRKYFPNLATLDMARNEIVHRADVENAIWLAFENLAYLLC